MLTRRTFNLVAVVLFAQSIPALAADLSPAAWPTAQRIAAENLEAVTTSPPVAHVVEGRAGIVSVTLSPIAALAGVEALKRGGTAADAAITAALTQVATGLGANVSYAGILELVYYDAGGRKVYALDAGWNSWRGERDPKSIPIADLSMFGLGAASPHVTQGATGRKTLVPGFMAGIGALHARFGKLAFRDLYAPAVWYAEKGVPVSPLLGAYFKLFSAPLAATAGGQHFVRLAGSDTPKAGDRFVQADLAQTLRAVASTGAQHMYAGKWGQNFVRAVRDAGGAADIADMKRYQPRWSEAANGTFGGYAIATSGDNLGARQVREALNLADELRVGTLPPYWQDPQSFMALSHILRWVQITAYDPGAVERLRAQGIDASVGQRVTPAYAKAVAPLIGTLYGGDPKGASSHHSAAVVAVDQWGDVAALVHSANTGVWGSSGLVVEGVPIPDAAAVNVQRIASLVPGDRVPNEMSPLIAMRNGKPVLAVATIGSSLIQETLRVLVGTLGNGGDLAAVMAAPPLLLNIDPMPPGMSPNQFPIHVPLNAYDPDFLARLRALGVNVQERSAQQVTTMKGTAAVVAIDGQGGVMRSAEVPGMVSFAAAADRSGSHH
jgi:gamma-glutamyltranspeptidase/glutathione hydrolase